MEFNHLYYRELSGIEHVCFVSNCQACSQVVRGYEAVGTYLGQASNIIETEVSTANSGVLENLKRHRNISISFLEMLDRKSKLEANQITALYTKIKANKAKVNQNRGVPGLESEVARLDAAIQAVKNRNLIYKNLRYSCHFFYRILNK